MWKRIGLFAALHALLAWSLSSDLSAQETSRPRCRAGNLWSQVDWARLEIHGGRLVVSSTRCGQSRLEIEPDAENGARQTLCVQMQPGTLLATYESTDARMQVLLQIDEKQLVVSRRGHEPGTVTQLRYVQPAAGDVTLVVGGDESKKHAAANLWQLLLAEPEIAREHLLPLLTQLQPSWQLGEQLAQIELALLGQAGDDVLRQHQAWQAAVNQLTDPRFPVRNEADRALRGAGQSVLGFLRQLDLSQLDPEQRRRIRAILAAAAHGGPDSPERVALWLTSDKRVWLALMGRGDLDQRIAAAGHLTRLCGRSIDFDLQATPAEQQAQLSQLRAKLAENR